MRIDTVNRLLATLLLGIALAACQGNAGAGDDGVYGTADDSTVDLGGAGHDSWTGTDGGAGAP